MEKITSVNNNHIKELSKLKEKKFRSLQKEFLVEGYHLVNEAYQTNDLIELFVTNEEDIKKFENVKNIFLTSPEVLSKLSETDNPQGIVGICKIKNSKIDFDKHKHILILDNVRDPGNVGTLIRTSLGFNIDLIILSNESVDIYNGKVVRASQGAIFKVDTIYESLEEIIPSLKANGIKVFGTSLDSSIKLNDIKKCENYAICLGNEANGMSDKVKALCDQNVFIDISPKLESLNVSIAGAILMYEFNK